MRERDEDIAAIELRREVLIAEFRSRDAQWQSVLAGLVATGGLGMLAYLGRTLDAVQAAWFVLGILAAVILVLLRLRRYRRAFQMEAKRIMSDLQRLKKGGGG